ncbi:MAG TPA: hypothetical protein VFW08_10830 [bacterium]|nr:hypothetical protein [bacterium]
MTELICVSCGRGGNLDDPLPWYEGTARDVVLEPDEAAVEEGSYLCGDCYRRIDPEDRPRWKPVSPRKGFIREATGG